MKNPPAPIGIYPNYDEIRRSNSIRGVLYRFLPIPLHTFLPLRQELYLFFTRLKGFYVRSRFARSRDILVNIGAGELGKRNWVNMDMIKLPGVNCVYDCRKSLPFKDNTVRGIFCEHFFEHLDYTEEVPYFISECWRVMLPGSTLRIILPDAEKYLHAYVQPGWGELENLRQLDEFHIDYYYKFAYRTKMELINMIFRQGHRHKYAYDFETLRYVLTKYGFSKVIQQEYLHSQDPELCLDQVERASESLYLDAVK